MAKRDDPAIGPDKVTRMPAKVPDAFDTMADEFARWAKERPGAADGDLDEARLLLALMRDYLDLAGPGDLGPGDLRSLLLEIYPRKVTVLNRQDAAATTLVVRDLLRFMAATGRVRSVARLERELDEIEPVFLDTLMDPAGWGMARSITTAMAADGVDLSDESAVSQWIASYNAHQDLGEPGEEDLFGDDAERAAAIKDAFGLPDRLPAVRLPEDGALASAARESRLLASARALAAWADGRELTADGDLVPADLAAAAQLLGIEVPSGAARLGEVPGLRQAWDLACCVYLADHDGQVARAGEARDDWPDGDDDAVLDVWAAAFGHLCGHSLAIDGQDDDLAAELSLDGAGAGLVMALFLARGEGMPRSECRSLAHELAAGELSPARARKARDAWNLAHGEMADLLLGRCRDHGAVEFDGDVVRLTPLAMWQMCEQLADIVEIPVLPPPAEMTAADLVAFGLEADSDELARERQAWLAGRPAADAARELLGVAAHGGPGERMMGASLAAAVGAAAGPLWREALGDPALAAYAKIALNEIAGRDPALDPLPGLEVGPEELVCVLADSIMATSGALDSADLAELVRGAVPPGQEEQVLELMGRSASPVVLDSLEILGRYHPDKKIAKSARKAAYRARSRAVGSLTPIR
jgi:hypothetical protein